MSDKRQWFYKPNPQDLLTKEQEAENERLIQEKEKERCQETNSK